MNHIRKLRFFVLIIIFIFLAGIFSVHAPTAEGVPAAPIVNTYTQSDGRVVFWRTVGDEFFNYSIDANGDLVVFKNDGVLYYANWASEGDFWENPRPPLVVPTDRKPTGVPANTSPPEYDDMPPLRSPAPRYIIEYVMKIRENAFNIEIPAIITVTLPGGIIGTNYDRTLNALGASPITWELDSGSLPNGLSLNASGDITGALTSADTFNFTVKAKNAAGHDIQALCIRVTLFDEKDKDKDKEKNGGGGCNFTIGSMIVLSAIPLLPLLCKKKHI